MAKVSLVSLGCPKNLVDSEGALGEIARAGHEIVADSARADVIVVNTCGFVESARSESVEAILQALECKRSGACRAVLVIGCLSQRFADELARELPDVDGFLGVGHGGKLRDAIEKALSGRRTVDASRPPREWVEPVERIRSTPPWTAYVKISDGCDNRCAYCAIPDIRGRYRSRPERLVIDEARRLADEGVKEIVLVGQDLTQYGADNGTGSRLPDLLVKLNEIDSLRWIRLMYCYPTKVTPALIEAIASLERVVKYVDLPLQHGDDRMLAAMNRRGSAADYERLVENLRAACPDVALRSTFIVGFPGETRKAFENLLGFMSRMRMDRVGAFVYSPEEGTPAEGLPRRVSRKVACARYDELMRLQQQISLERNRSFLGKKLEVLVEGRQAGCVYGRSYRDAPEIDGVVHLGGTEAEPGSFVAAKVTGFSEYDLEAEAEDRGKKPRRRDC